MSAALAHVITRDCRTNEMDCPCGTNVTLPDDGSDTTVERGCSDNIQFGLEMSAKFMEGKERQGTIIGNRQRINLQNILVGRTVSVISCNCLFGNKTLSIAVSVYSNGNSFACLPFLS